MIIEVNSRHMFILLLVLIVGGVFSYVFLEANHSSLTGFVVMDDGVRVSTEKMDNNLVQEINSGNFQPRVVVVLNDGEDIKEIIEQKQEQVIAELKQEVKVVDLEKVDSNLAEDTLNQADFQVTHKFENINAIAGEVNDAQVLVELTKNVNVKKIVLDYPITIDLDQSIKQIDADKVWNITINGTSIDGSGEAACIIDTGVDYTHGALGSCNLSKYVLEGNIVDLTQSINLVPVESAHPYADNYDHTWAITLSNFSNIALHFKNISLEQISNAGDTTDRIYVYNSLNQTIAIYKGVMDDVWTPASIGDTIYVRLLSDSSVTSYGFFIDQAIDGITNMTMNWSSCNKVVGGWDTYNNDPDPKDDHGHGTHVAGIIASLDGTYKGVASGAKVVAVKALSASGSGYSSDVIAALEWCTTNAEKLNISVISMSLGCDGGSCVHYQDYCNNDILAEGIGKAYDKNISVFIAAGNSGWSDGISTPSCVEKAIPIGGVGSTDNILFNRGNLLKILAPAYNIHSSVLNNGWMDYSGTSMATPHAAATALLMNQYWKNVYGVKPSLEAIENKMRLTGVNVYDSASNLNFSRINALHLIEPRINVSDNSINSEIAINSSLLIDVYSDVELHYAWLEWNSSNSSVYYNMTGSSKLFSYQLDYLSGGNYSYSIYGFDAIGRAGISSLRNIQAVNNISVTNNGDNGTYFEIDIKEPINNSYISGEIQINFSVKGDNIVKVGYNLSNNTTVLLESWNESINSNNYTYFNNLSNNYTDGNYNLLFTAVDNQSNKTKKMIYFIINKTLAVSNNTLNLVVINITSPVNGAVLEVGDLTIFEASTNISNGNYTWYFGDGDKAYGLSVTKRYNTTGDYDVTFNVSNSEAVYLRNISVVVNDTIGPAITSIWYDKMVHLSQDVTQRVNISVFDYSGINNVSLLFNGSVLSGTKMDGNYSWLFNVYDIGNTHFVITLWDNFSSSHNTSASYNFNVVSCNDKVQNGDEIGIDCGGSCNVCTNVSVADIPEIVNPHPVVVETPAETPIKVEEVKQESIQNAVQTTALSSSGSQQVIYEKKEVNWITELKKAKIQEKENSLIGLGVLIFMLAFVYLFIIRKEL
ncbi:S8 family serine peptidase [Candidatus Woesearchaeota archaeon]|nr:S8 family serine peptidase [Candidatus Woesearchaeota archaeon]